MAKTNPFGYFLVMGSAVSIDVREAREMFTLLAGPWNRVVRLGIHGLDQILGFSLFLS